MLILSRGYVSLLPYCLPGLAPRSQDWLRMFWKMVQIQLEESLHEIRVRRHCQPAGRVDAKWLMLTTIASKLWAHIAYTCRGQGLCPRLRWLELGTRVVVFVVIRLNHNVNLCDFVIRIELGQIFQIEWAGNVKKQLVIKVEELSNVFVWTNMFPASDVTQVIIDVITTRPDLNSR